MLRLRGDDRLLTWDERLEDELPELRLCAIENGERVGTSGRIVEDDAGVVGALRVRDLGDELSFAMLLSASVDSAATFAAAAVASADLSAASSSSSGLKSAINSVFVAMTSCASIDFETTSPILRTPGQKFRFRFVATAEVRAEPLTGGRMNAVLQLSSNITPCVPSTTLTCREHSGRRTAQRRPAMRRA